MKKKILLLGGSHNQIPAIKKAKEYNLHTILCDYLPDNPGKKVADEFYQVSTTDKQAVLEIAKSKQVDFIFGYASDPAAPTAAFVSEKLHLPGNSSQSVEILTKKHLYRGLLENYGFLTPRFVTAKGANVTSDMISGLTFPVVVKPVDSSDTKGVTLVKSINEIHTAAEKALKFSKLKKIIVEEFIDCDTADLHGDAFFIEGEMIFCMLGDRIYSSMSNPLKPSTELYPSRKSENLTRKAKAEVEKIVKKSGFKNGAVNLEIKIDSEENIYVMEIGPRSGGTLTPQAIAYATGFDMLDATFKWFTNSEITIPEPKITPSILFALHVNDSGVFEDFMLEKKVQKYLKESHLYVKKGDELKPYSSAGSTIGVLIFTFHSMREAEDVIDSLYHDVINSVRMKVKVCS